LVLDTTPSPILTNTTYINFMNQVEPIIEILKKLDKLVFPIIELDLPDPVARIPDDEDNVQKELKVAVIKNVQSVVVEMEENKSVDEDDGKIIG
jgi:hypothetical protein